MKCHKAMEMDVKSYNAAQAFGSGRHFNSQVGYLVDWHKGSGVSWLRTLVRRKIINRFLGCTNVAGNLASDFVLGIEAQLFMEAASEVMVNDVLPETEVEDVILNNELFENRFFFLSFCEKNHYQFDTPHRAKYSSIMILHHLQNLTARAAGNICIICHNDGVVDQIWVCGICPEFDVCAKCFQEKGSSCHIHKLIRSFPTASHMSSPSVSHVREDSSSVSHVTEDPPSVSHVTEDPPSVSQVTDSSSSVSHVMERSPPLSHATRCTKALENTSMIKKLVVALEHASKCPLTSSQPCHYPNCLQMKRLFHHANRCTVRVSGGCTLCRKAWVGLSSHSASCRESSCSVPRCI